MLYHPPQTSLWQAVTGHSLRPHCAGNFLYWMHTPSPEEEIEVNTSNQGASNHLFHAKLSAPLQCFCQFVEAALVPLNRLLPSTPAMRNLLLKEGKPYVVVHLAKRRLPSMIKAMWRGTCPAPSTLIASLCNKNIKMSFILNRFSTSPVTKSSCIGLSPTPLPPPAQPSLPSL